MIDGNTISQIQESAQIDEVVGDFVNLKRRGVNMIGLCPFHNEKTPSFTVSPAKGIFKCFGCGKGGDSVSFVMEHESYSYPEALKYLAKKYGIEIEETERDEAFDEQQRVIDSLFIVNEYAKSHFQKQLLETEEGKTIGQSYFRERGYNEHTIQKFGLGYCDESYDSFTQKALGQQYQLEYLQKLGLTTAKHNDFFRGRVIFPIHNLSGKVIGFGARTLKSDKKIPKYVNSPESEIYNKRKILYGLYTAKSTIRQEDNCYLVEGYTDVISLSQAGIENVVASSGTALTEQQVRLIRRFTPNITIIYDGDEAGIKASFRGIDLMLEQDVNIKIAALPKGEDPDSFIKELGANGFKDYINQHTYDFIVFKTKVLLKDSQNDPIRKAKVVNEVIESIVAIPDAVKRSLFLKECSEILKIDERVLINEYNKVKKKKLKKKATKSGANAESLDYSVEEETVAKKQSETEIGIDIQEQNIIRVLLEFGDKEIEDGVPVITYVKEQLEDISFQNNVFQRIFEILHANPQNGIPLIRNHQEELIKNTYVSLISTPYELSYNWLEKHEIVVTQKEDNLKQDVFISIARYQSKKVEIMLKESQEKLKSVNNEDDQIQVLKEIQSLKSMHLQLCKFLGIVVTSV